MAIHRLTRVGLLVLAALVITTVPLALESAAQPDTTAMMTQNGYQLNRRSPRSGRRRMVRSQVMPSSATGCGVLTHSLRRWSIRPIARMVCGGWSTLTRADSTSLTIRRRLMHDSVRTGALLVTQMCRAGSICRGWRRLRCRSLPFPLLASLDQPRHSPTPHLRHLRRSLAGSRHRGCARTRR